MSNLTPRVDRIDINNLINGALQFWQRGNSRVADISENNFYLADRFKGNASGGFHADGNNVTYSKVAFSSGEMANSALRAELTTLGTVDQALHGMGITQPIENNFLPKLNRKKLNFKIRASRVGTYKVGITDLNGTEYFNFDIEAVDTFEQKDIDIDLSLKQRVDSADNGLAISVNFEFGSLGSTTHLFQQAGDYFEISEMMLHDYHGVEQEEFRIAGRNYSEELQLCQRYFSKTMDLEEPIDSNSNNGRVSHRAYATASKRLHVPHLVRMRVPPVVTLTNNTGANFFVSVAGETGVDFQSNNTASGFFSFQFYSDAEL